VKLCVALAIVLASGAVAFAQADLKTLEASEFCKSYGCPKPDTWPLRDGSVNNNYKPNVRPSVSLEAPTSGGKVKSYGLVFYERRVLTPKDLEMVWSLIRSIHPGGDTPTIKTFVQTHVAVKVEQIMQAKTTVVGPFRVWAGKVGQEQVVHIERDAPAVTRPAFTQVGHQGMTYLVVVPPQQAADDRQLLVIANYLSSEEKRVGGRGEVHVWAWTDKQKAASRIPMTDTQANALAAQVHINPSKGVQSVHRPNR